MDAETLARIQFGFTAAFHYIFPPISIGLGLVLVFMEGMYLKTKDPIYHQMTRFWVRIFALVFSVGVATGIVLEFEFGTNWASYARYVGDIFGSALAAEGIFAFFLESGFLAVLVFGWNRVSPRMHFFSTIMVALGSMFSAVWIIVANSWQQTPAGYTIGHFPQGDRAMITDFWAMVFNPSSIQRLTHTVVGAWATGAFLVVSVSAYYLLKNRHVDFAKASLKVALPIALISSLLQPLLGHISIIQVAQTQPAKFAAFEGHYDSSKPMDLYLFGWTNQKTKTTKGIAIPGMASLLLDWDFAKPFDFDRTKPVVGLDKFPSKDQPPVSAVFQTYHAMIAVGMLMILLALVGTWFLRTGKLQNQTLILKALVPAALLPHIANETGWMSAELGRQPWVVYGQLRTSDGLSKAVSEGQIWTSLILFTLLYLLLFVLFIYLLNKKIKQGPTEEDMPAKAI
jgi:cytochrome d ubiquinol oxidase subunit I